MYNKDMYHREIMILSDYLSYLKTAYGFHVTITDNIETNPNSKFSDFLHANSFSRDILQPYLVHGNRYCMQIKMNKELWDKCVCLKERICNKFESNTSMLYGMCHAGIEEFILPVKHKGEIIALIHAGSFCSNEYKSIRHIKNICKKYKLDEKLLLDSYFSNVRREVPDKDTIEILLNAAAICISSIYAHIEPMINDLNSNRKSTHRENYILLHILEYIKQNYKDDITASDISRFCHCSKSYISHVFCQNMKQNINIYINKLRIDEAKRLLASRKKQVKDISSEVGFNDPNYFSKVFTDMTGMSPREYRKKYSIHN